MLRDLNILRRNSGKNHNVEDFENVPVNPTDSLLTQAAADTTRAPLNTIPEPRHQNKVVIDQELSVRNTLDRTPTKFKGKTSDLTLPIRTPEKHGMGVSSRNRFGWGQNNETSTITAEIQSSKGVGIGNGSFTNTTPRSARTVGRATSGYSESNSTQTTPTKSVSKPPNPVFASISRGVGVVSGGSRGGNFAALSKGIPISSAPLSVVDTVDVPHFDLKEDPSFWMDHNVQVLIRVRPLNSTEKSMHGYSRCLKQESARSITWIGQPETRFTFDHVACETVNQEMLFRMAGLPMVENCLSGYNSCMFAYGQTGSGKTYTMLGDIDELEVKPSPNRGMTPRIFEFLFARIRAEEESRRDECLKYNCKCSFLEIYNEQVTDLLDPSSSNLLLREDIKKGVYVENLSEFEVRTVNDILKLLTQGSSNRKVAATNMNRESSRSHSVFTCVIESRWEKDSTTNLRFARLNLVDLAGSERQKTSGAEGERLKEAANINKSLSTLGHVIMVLVDVANGKPKHVPYRDSRLTFLLQDSLGGNSKTMIIANVSPSICCAAETLNSLKFAQRAKLIKNNAVVNEDSSGDVAALQHQIWILKEELSALKRQNISRSLSFDSPQEHETSCAESPLDMDNSTPENFPRHECKGVVRVTSKQLKSLETTLAGALRREQMAESSIKQREAEIEQLNRLVRQREEDAKCTKMMLRFREDKIQRMESLINGLMPSENYLLEENIALSEEIQLLVAKVDRNPEVTRFALENIRLLDQLRRFQDFYEEGEREILIIEVSEMRNQLLQFLDGNSKQQIHPYMNMSPQEAPPSEVCLLNAAQHDIKGRNTEEVMNLELEADILKIILKEERSSHAEMEEKVLLLSKQCQDANNKLNNAMAVIEALESQQILSIHEMEDLKNSNNHFLKLLSEKELEIFALKEQIFSQETMNLKNDDSISPLQEKLMKMQNSLEKAKRMTKWYHNNCQSQNSNKEEREEVCREVENETAEVIVCLQEELAILQQQIQDSNLKEIETKNKLVVLENEMNEKLCLVTQENRRLVEVADKKDQDLRKLLEEWELLIREIHEILSDGHEELKDACDQTDFISNSFAQNKKWLSEKFGKMVRIISGKELQIEEINRCLEEANIRRGEVECMLRSLRGATLVITEEKEKEINLLTSQLNAKTSTVSKLKDQIQKASSCAMVAFVVANWFSEINFNHRDSINYRDIELRELKEMNIKKDGLILNQAKMIERAEQQIQSLRMDLNASEAKLEKIEEGKILEAKEKLVELKTGVSTLESCMNEHDRYTGIKMIQNTRKADPYVVEELKNLCNRDVTIALLRKEIESAIESLKGVEAQMAKLHEEKEEIRMSEKHRRETMEGLKAQVIALKEAMSNFEKQANLSFEVLDDKLSASEDVLQEAIISWRQSKKLLELELSDAKEVSLEKTLQVSCLLAKFEEAHCTMKEADAIVNKLLITNEALKLELEAMREMKSKLIYERDTTVNEVQCLKSIIDEKDHQYETLEGQFSSELIEIRSLVQELEGVMGSADNQNLSFIDDDIQCLKSQLIDSGKLMRSSVEDIWSEIIVKDCAMSVLHLCHMGILLETVNGLNAENGFLHHGLCESNAIIADLREHNFKSRRELEMCRVLEGKLLSDIKSNFDRISRRENETGKFRVKLSNFEKKIMDLQNQEELMLQRSDHMGSELALLMKELDLTNVNMLNSLLDQENLLSKKEEIIKSQDDFLMTDLLEKEFELLILVSELEQVSTQMADMKREKIFCFSIIEELEKKMIFLMINSELKEQLLTDMELEVTLLREVHEERMLYIKELEVDLKMKETNLNLSCTNTSALDQLNQTLRDKICLLEKENVSLESVVGKLKAENCIVLRDLMEKKSECEISLSRIYSCENSFVSLQADLDKTNAKLIEMQCSQSIMTKDLHDHTNKMNELKDENDMLRTNLRSHLQGKVEIAKCVNSIEALDITSGRIIHKLNEECLTLSAKMFQQILENTERASTFAKEFEFLERFANDMISENSSLKTDLMRKDEILKGLLFDLSMLQESAANAKDQRDKIDELFTSFGVLEYDLSVKSTELEESVASCQRLEAQLQEKLDAISSLESEISKAQEFIKLISDENVELRAEVEDALSARNFMEEELIGKRKVADNLETEIFEMGNAISQMSSSIESLKSDLNKVTSDRDHLYEEMILLKEKVEMAEALADENEAIAMEAQQMAETRKVHAEEKEEEVKLLERSVEELECTINVLENKIDIVKEEAERQRLEREELELVLHAVKCQLQNVKNGCLDENEKDQKEALKRIQILERELADKDAEISKFKAHITELNLHAEAQACEYKQKFKMLEAAVAEQAKPECALVHNTNASSNKSEKNSTKSRGSGSPFKCIGLGLAQQIKSEKDEELNAGRLRIEELEALATSRQKEIFMLNARLAAAESMTHDVIRDLLGLKLDMSNYASLLDNQQVQKITEKARLPFVESQGKDQEAIKLKKQLNEFIEERRGWLDDIERKQAEMVASQIALEKLHQRVQLLTAENDMLKLENANHKKKVIELEGEANKLSGQQNLHQRIHHHAKIKEENNVLKSQNEDLSAKLRQSEEILSRVKEELARYRASSGRDPCINLEKEQSLNKKLKEAEEERQELAQKLLGLCTGILKAAGTTRPPSDGSACVSAAEEAVEQLKNKVVSLEMELQDLQFKNRIIGERIRLSEFMPQSSPLNSVRTEENCRSPKVASHNPFLSAFDR